MTEYKTKDKLREATAAELASVAGVSLETAQQLYEMIHSM